MGLFDKDLVEQELSLQSLLESDFRTAVQTAKERFNKASYLYKDLNDSTKKLIYQSKIIDRIESSMRFGSWTKNKFDCIYMYPKVFFTDDIVKLIVMCSFSDPSRKWGVHNEYWEFVEKI